MSIPRNLGNFADNVNANGKVEVTGINATGTPSASTVLYGNGTWAAAGGGSSQWTTSGLNIYYSTGKVGIGTSTIASQLDVRNGATNATGINTNANQISITHNSNTGVGGQVEPAGFVVVRDKASTTASGDFLGGLSWNSRYSDTEDRAGYASILAVATGAGTADLTFNTSSSNLTTAERLRLNGNGALILSGGTATANGVGITFPATQSASSDANTLDDYEEGTWTPVLARTGSSYTFTDQVGRYVKIGKLVTCTFSLDISAITTQGSSYNTLTGLPFTPINSPKGTGVLSIKNPLTTALGFYWAGQIFFHDGTGALQSTFSTGSMYGQITFEV